jgi:hypothetical protein
MSALQRAIDAGAGVVDKGALGLALRLALGVLLRRVALRLNCDEDRK